MIDRLNAFSVLRLDDMSWDVRKYRVTSQDGRQLSHSDRSRIKSAFWDVYRANKNHCRGGGFIIDVNASTVITSSTWRLPDISFDAQKLNIELVDEFTARMRDAMQSAIVEGILREGLKNCVKKGSSRDLGELWQDYACFCQMPELGNGNRLCFCRRFYVGAKELFGGNWVVQLDVGTTAVDGRAFDDYYRQGRARDLMNQIEIKRSNRTTRQNQDVAVRVLRIMQGHNGTAAEVLEVVEPDLIESHAALKAGDQAAISNGYLNCVRFGKPISAYRMSELHLILDSQLTQDDHELTIIDPSERYKLAQQMRTLIEGADIFGQTLRLATDATPINFSHHGQVELPSIWVADKERKCKLLPSPKQSNSDSLRARGRDRARHIARNGYFNSRPIHPMLAVPQLFSDERAERMLADLHQIWRAQGIRYSFGIERYSNPDDLIRAVDRGGYDSAIVVLPESSRGVHSANDFHEQVKRRLEIPSQCVHHDNTLPESIMRRSPSQYGEGDKRIARRTRNTYELCLGNLLVKHNWVPFVPAESFAYNVHVGIDVGGTHNTTAMLCVGHGYSKPHLGLIFLPEQIPIHTQKAEPIPSEQLFAGLDETFGMLRRHVENSGSNPDFASVLFLRDGHYFGFEDQWNELDAIKRLHKRFLERGWITESAIWTAVEILKLGEGWRVFNCDGHLAGNPLVGRYAFPFADPNEGLVCTTGSPYLPKGTAAPLRIRIHQISGEFDRDAIVREIVWESDMCFTKLDAGQRLPWVLSVADTGALQSSRQYRISGIPT